LAGSAEAAASGNETNASNVSIRKTGMFFSL
jgi:hypothetical protein